MIIYVKPKKAPFIYTILIVLAPWAIAIGLWLWLK